MIPRLMRRKVRHTLALAGTHLFGDILQRGRCPSAGQRSDVRGAHGTLLRLDGRSLQWLVPLVFL